MGDEMNIKRYLSGEDRHVGTSRVVKKDSKMHFDQPIFELPICDVCNKPVEYMDARNDINFDAQIFRVKCHGEVQEVALTALTMIDCTVTAGRAFVRERLE